MIHGTRVANWRADSQGGRVGIDGRRTSTPHTEGFEPAWSPGKLAGNLLFRGADPSTSRIVNSTARLIDSSRSGTARQMQPGRSYDFPGTDHVAAATQNFGNGTTDSPFSISAWVFLDAYNAQIAGTYGTSGATREWVFLSSITTGYLKLILNDSSAGAACSGETNEAVGLSAWHHVTATYDGTGGASAASGITLYIDGVSKAVTQANNASYVAMEATGQDFWVGLSSFTYMNGKMFDVRVYDRALTAAEVLTIASMSPYSTDIGPTDPLVWYKGDEESGLVAYDSSGNENHGTITAATEADFHDDSVNDQFSFQNEVGYNTATRYSGSVEFYQGDTTIGDAIGTTSSFSAAAWIKADTTASNDGIINMGNLGSTQGEYALVVAAGLLYVLVDNAVAFATTAYTDTAGWHHVAGTYDGANIRLYLDGVLKTTTPHVATLAMGSLLTNIGTTVQTGGGQQWQGMLSGVAIEGAVWDLATINAIKNGTGIPSTAWYFPHGNGTETQQGLAPLTATGTPDVHLIPRAEDDTADDIRNYPLAVSGANPHDAILSTPCFTGDGIADSSVSANNSGITGDAVFSISTWVRVGTLVNYDTVMSFGNENIATNVAGLVVMADGSWGLSIGGANDAHSAASSISTDTWYHLCITKAAGNINATTTLYLDGTSIPLSSPSSATPAITDERFYVGSLSNVSFFDGRIADARVYTEELSAAEVLYLATGGNSGTDPTETNLAVRYPLSEGWGGTTHDVSGNQNHGTITGTESDIWANTQNVHDTLVVDGYSLATRFFGEYYNRGSRLTSGALPQLSVACWVMTSQNAIWIASEAEAAADYGWYLRVQPDGKAHILIDGAGNLNAATYKSYSTSVAIDDGDWHHVGFVFDADTLVIYLDGVVDSHSAANDGTVTTIFDGTGPFQIGSYNVPSAAGFNGYISGVTVEAAAWSAATVASLYTGTIPSTAWRFRDGNGIEHNQRATVTATNYSGAGEYQRGAGTIGTAVDGTTDLSMACWFRAHDTSSNDGILELGPFSAAFGSAHIAISSNLLYFRINNVASNESVAFTSNEWHHVALTYDGVNVKGYLDGTEVTTDVFSTNLAATGDSLTIGAYHSSATPFDGQIAEVVVEGAGWSAATVALVRDGTIPAGAWYFPAGNGVETQQGLAALTETGTPDTQTNQRMPTAFEVGDPDQIIIPEGIIPVTIGPGILPPSSSLDLGGGEANSPYAQQLADVLADLTYDTGDDDEAAVQFARVLGPEGDDRIMTVLPAATGDDLENLEDYTS